MFKNKTPRILAVTAGLPAKRNPLVMALHDKYGAQVQAGKRFQDNRLDRYLRKLNLAGLIGTHAKNLRSLNHEILKRAGHFDILFIVKGNFVYAKTLKKLKQMSIPPLIVGWSPDDVYLPHNNSKVLLDSAPYFDVFFTAKSLNISNGELSSIGFKDARFLKQGFDSVVHRPIKEKDSWFTDKVTFIGFGEQDRFEKVNYLAQNGIIVHVWGNGWTKKMRRNAHPNLKIYGSPLLGDDYSIALSNSAINLCFLRKLNRDLHTSRTFEIPACEGFMVAERTHEHSEYFEEDVEAAYFDDEAELLSKVLYYLDRPDKRREISALARRRCIDNRYSYSHIADVIIQEVSN